MSVRLRKLGIQDLEMVMNWRMLPEITQFMYTNPKITMEDQLQWFARISESDKEKYWIIELDGEVPVGLLSINQIDYVNKQCSWAYYIADLRARGKGLGTLLECNVYDFVFGLGLNKLWCEVFTFNDKVIRIHEKFGSKIEGTFKDHINKNGEFYDVVRMAIRKDEWALIKDQYEYSSIEIEA
jgi:UDP-4-amino-4,6-dideoxy-N-acetyl-beta-L-altrosamine N-acetyltransferase